MILAQYAKFLQEHDRDFLLHKTSPIELLHVWLFDIVNKNPKTNVDKIIHKEILCCKNENGDYFIAGKSDSGRVLLSALIEFSKSYENYNHAKWLQMTEKSFYV